MYTQPSGVIGFTWRNTLTVLAGSLLFMGASIWVLGVIKLSERDLLSAGALFAFGVLGLWLSRTRS